MGKKKSLIQVLLGVFKDNRTGRGVTDLGDAMDQASVNRCCGVDCCEGIIRLPDKGLSDVKRVAYIKDGVWVIGTEAAYLEDKAGGFA